MANQLIEEVGDVIIRVFQLPWCSLCVPRIYILAAARLEVVPWLVLYRMSHTTRSALNPLQGC